MLTPQQSRNIGIISMHCEGFISIIIDDNRFALAKGGIENGKPKK